MSEIIEIVLDKNLIAWLDEEDGDLARMGWSARNAGRDGIPTYYAVHTWRIGEARGEYYLHNLVWERMTDAPVPKGFLVDHINRDKLDNRRANLRLATRSDNEANKRKRRGKTTSRYKGVNKMKDGKRKKRWRAIVTVKGEQIPLGCYLTEKEAARAYDKAAFEHYGEFAYLNFPEEHAHEQHDD